MDEKSSVQSLDRSQPSLPMVPGRAETMTHDDKRHGTTTLFAALDVLTGQVIGSCLPQHRHEEFLKFVKTIDREVPKSLAVLILDNDATHKHPAVRAWLDTHPRFQLHFTPTSSSWLNVVERWFANSPTKPCAVAFPFGARPDRQDRGVPDGSRRQRHHLRLDGYRRADTRQDRPRTCRPRKVNQCQDTPLADEQAPFLVASAGWTTIGFAVGLKATGFHPGDGARHHRLATGPVRPRRPSLRKPIRLHHAEAQRRDRRVPAQLATFSIGLNSGEQRTTIDRQNAIRARPAASTIERLARCTLY